MTADLEQTLAKLEERVVALGARIAELRQTINPEIGRLAEAVGEPVADLLTYSRPAYLIRARQFIHWWLYREHGLMRAKRIAVRNNQTIMHSVRTVEDRLETDKKYAEWHEKVLAKLENNPQQ